MALVFPNYIPGVLFTQRKSPTFKTGVHTAITGKESRLAYRGFPMYQWELEYELLRDYADGRTNFVPSSQDFTTFTGGHGGAGLPGIIIGNYVGGTAPDGTFTADRVILNALPGSSTGDTSSCAFAASQNPISPPMGQVCTLSIWMMTADGSTVTVGMSGLGSNRNCTVTGSWQRFSFTSTRNAISTTLIQVFTDAGGVKNAYADLLLWGAQVEPGGTMGSYIPTFGSPVVAGDLKSLFGFFNAMLGQQGTFLYQDPDFNTVSLVAFATGNGSLASFPLTAPYMAGNDYIAPFGQAGLPELIQNTSGSPQIYTTRYQFPELLSTGSRTNLAKHSNFEAAWATLTNIALTSNAQPSPDGTTDAGSLNIGTTAGVHSIQQGAITITASGRYTFSCWLRYSTQQYVALNFDNGSTDGVTATFDLLNGIASAPFLQGTAYASAEDVTITPAPGTSGGNPPWYRCSISGQLAAADTSARVSVTAMPNATSQWYPTWTPASQVFFAWGAQLESGTVPTALIVTTSASATNGGSDYSISATNVVTPAATLASGVQWAWTGSFYYLVRFAADSLDFDEVLYQFWELKKLQLQQVKL